MKQKDSNRLKMKSHKNFTTNTIFSRSKFIAALSVAATLMTSCGNDSATDNNIPSEGQGEIIAAQLDKSEVSILGRWRSHDNEFYRVIEFKGKSTLFWNYGDPRSYERDGAFIRVFDDPFDKYFEIVSKDSIIGHSLYAEGVWVREN